MTKTYVPILRHETLLPHLPRKCCAAIAKHAVRNLCPHIQRENVFKVDPRAGSDALHLFHERYPSRLLEIGEKLHGFEADFGPVKLGSAYEHAFVESYATMDLVTRREAVLLPDLEGEGLVVAKIHGLEERGSGFAYLVRGAMALDFEHVDDCVAVYDRFLLLCGSHNLRALQHRYGTCGLDNA